MIVTPLVNTLYKGKPAPAGTPIDVDKKWGESMIEMGKVKAGKPVDFDIADVDVDLDENTVKELLKIAEQLEIEVPKGAKKADIVALIAEDTKQTTKQDAKQTTKQDAKQTTKQDAKQTTKQGGDE